jgi:hypothetical protein
LIPRHAAQWLKVGHKKQADDLFAAPPDELHGLLGCKVGTMY